MAFAFVQADTFRIPLPDRSVDLVLGSPPYVNARKYLEGGRNLGIARKVDAWVEWMLGVTAECLRISRGPVVWIAAGKTKARNYWPACEGLMWRWFKQGLGSGLYLDGIEIPRATGGSMYRPCYWYRVGIAGSGSDQWFRSDVEYAMCFKRPGPLPWADNKACGHPPKWAPGGSMSHRLTNGQRVNQWGKTGTDTGTTQSAGGVIRHGKARPSHRTVTKRMHQPSGAKETQTYQPPAIANPGNLLNIPVGGGMMGSPLAHENEAPYPERLAEFFIRSLCPPGGIVCDTFSGSGTTADVANRLDRHGIGFDLRWSQCELGVRRARASMKPASPLDPAPPRKPLCGQLSFLESTGA
jgi:hypothetical protein